MQDGQNMVSRDEFQGRVNVEDERFARGKAQIAEISSVQKDLTTLIATTSQLVQQHDKKIDRQQDILDGITALTKQTEQLVRRHDEMLAKNDQRLGKLEEKPGKRWENLLATVIAVVATALVTYLIKNRGT